MLIIQRAKIDNIFTKIIYFLYLIITKQFFYGILLLKLFFMKMHIINENLI